MAADMEMTSFPILNEIHRSSKNALQPISLLKQNTSIFSRSPRANRIVRHSDKNNKRSVAFTCDAKVNHSEHAEQIYFIPGNEHTSPIGINAGTRESGESSRKSDSSKRQLTSANCGWGQSETERVSNVKVITDQNFVESRKNLSFNENISPEDSKSKCTSVIDDKLELSHLHHQNSGKINFVFQEDDGVSSFACAKFYDRIGGKGVNREGLQDATDILCLTDEKVIVTDMVNNKLQIFDKYGRPCQSYAREDMSEPWSTVITPQGHIAVTCRKRKCVLVLSSEDGSLLNSFGQLNLCCPSGLVLDENGNFIVTDIKLQKIFWFTPKGKLIDEMLFSSNFLNEPRYATISSLGQLIVSDSGNHCIRIFDKSGRVCTSFGSFGRNDGQFRFPYGVCTDASGNIIVADRYNDRVSLFTKRGDFVNHIVTANQGIYRPQGVALSSDLKLYITHGDIKACEVISYSLPYKPLKHACIVADV